MLERKVPHPNWTCGACSRAKVCATAFIVATFRELRTYMCRGSVLRFSLTDASGTGTTVGVVLARRPIETFGKRRSRRTRLVMNELGSNYQDAGLTSWNFGHVIARSFRSNAGSLRSAIERFATMPLLHELLELRLRYLELGSPI